MPSYICLELNSAIFNLSSSSPPGTRNSSQYPVLITPDAQGACATGFFIAPVYQLGSYQQLDSAGGLLSSSEVNNLRQMMSLWQTGGLTSGSSGSSPFNLSYQEGGAIAAAVVAVWALAWGIRSMVKTINPDSSE
jgi:hypothetical protein